MSEDLADAIVMAAKRMERESPPMEYVLLYQRKRSGLLHFLGLKEWTTKHFTDYLGAYNCLIHHGFSEVRDTEVIETVLCRQYGGKCFSKGFQVQALFGRPCSVIIGKIPREEDVEVEA